MKKIAFGLLTLLIPIGSASAEESALVNLSLEELGNIEVTSAVRSEQRAADAPATVYVFTDSDIARRGYRNLVQLLGDVPEIEVNVRGSVENYNLLSARGVYGNDKNLLILQDGIRVSAITGSQTPTHYNYPLHHVKRVEVVLGPGSALYGADALMGVVNLITRDAVDLEGGIVTGSVGRFSTTDNSAIYGKTVGDVGLVINASQFYSAEPFFPEYYPDQYSGYNTYTQTGTVEGVSGPIQVPVQAYSNPTKAYTIGGKITLADFELGYWRNFSWLGSSLGGRPERTLYVNQAKIEASIEVLYARYRYTTPNKKWVFKTELSKGLQTTHPESLYLDAYTDFAPAYKYETDRSINFEEQAIYSLSTNSSLTVGFVYQDFSALPKSPDLPSPFDPSVATSEQGLVFPGTNIPIPFYSVWYQNYGPYAQLRSRLSEKVELTLGARYDYNTRFGGSLNPRVGAVISPSDKLTIKLLYGEAFRAPSPYIEYQTFGTFFVTNGVPTGGFFALPNPGLEPEKIRSLEASASYLMTQDFQFSTDIFVNRLSNVITSSILPPGTLFMGVPVSGTREQNGGLLISYGGTARLELASRKNSSYVRPYVAYTLIAGNLDDDPLPNAAKHTVKTGVDLTLKKLTLSPRLEYRTRSYVQNSPDVYAPTYYVINLGARYEDIFGTEKWKTTLWANIYNLLDRRYSNSNIQNFVYFGATPQAPLSFQLGATVSF